MTQLYQDALAIMRNVGRPDLFITMTCNPKWPEFQRLLEKFPKGTTYNDLPNLLNRLFNIKFKSLINDIIQGGIFGKIIAWIYVVEQQKRGLSHIHFLGTLSSEDKGGGPILAIFGPRAT